MKKDTRVLALVDRLITCIEDSNALAMKHKSNPRLFAKHTNQRIGLEEALITVKEVFNL